MKSENPRKLNRREFINESAKGALAIGFLSVGFNGAFARSYSGKVIDMSRLSTCSIALNHLPAEEAFPIITAAGYKKVDVHEKVHFLIFDDLCDHEELKAIADKSGLRIAHIASYLGGGLFGRNMMYAFHHWDVPHADRFTRIGFSSNDPDDLKTEFEQMKKTIDLAYFFGSKSVRIFPGNDNPDTIDKMVPWFKRSAEYAAEKNVCLAFENEGVNGKSISGTPEFCVQLSEKVDMSNFGVLYEPGNLMNNGTEYRGALETMKNHVIHCHFKDCKPVDNICEMQPFGQGVIDFPWIVEKLEKVGYKGDYSLEFELHDVEPEGGIKQFRDDFAALFDEQINDPWAVESP